jgi:hypothetical protein
MDSQLALFETPRPVPLKYRLFVGIFPVLELLSRFTICRSSHALGWDCEENSVRVKFFT